MRELVEFITKSLVDEPAAVRVTQVDGEHAVVLEVRVAALDMGKVIGKQGRIARALRAVVKAAAVRAGKRVMVEIVQ
ncbi:MAG TPA: KH domain-containing protein [bacterium]